MKIQIPQRGILTCYLKILVALFRKIEKGSLFAAAPGGILWCQKPKKGNPVSLR